MASLTPGRIVATLAPIVGRAGAAGIAGNLQQESSDNPASAGGGLAQWQGSRYAGLVNYARSRGLPATSAEAALGYLTQDLKGPYSGLAQQLRQAQNPAHAADLFSNIYERPSVPMLANRESYARQAAGAAPASALSPAGVPSVPGGSGTQTTTTFDQAAFDRAQRAAIAGQFLANSARSVSMWQTGPKSTVPGGVNLFGPGMLTTTPPSRADYTTTHVTAAQNGLQTLAGSTALNSHPGLGGDFSTPTPQKIVDMQNFAKTLIGAPYSKANHAGAFSQGANLIKRYGTDCSGLVSLLLGRAGVLSSPQTTDTIAAQPGIQAGRGQHVTMWNRANAGNNSHIIIQIGRDWFESGGRIGGGVTQMSDSQAQQELSGGGFQPLHPRGF
jgi:hypothetical protein